jgi:hypothetical protein
MALSNLPQVATVSGVYTPRDFTQQLNDMSSNSANALRNAFDFAIDIQNEMVKNKQSKLMDDEIKRQQILKENIANDERLLVKLQKELELLKNGEDVEVRKGTQMLQQNNTKPVQDKLDMLNSIDGSMWNWANVSGGAV